MAKKPTATEQYEPLTFDKVLAACGGDEAAAKDIWKWSKPCITLLREVQNTIETDQDDCYLFGIPFVPANFLWPKDSKGNELIFLCHVALSKLPRNETTSVLPQDGYLQFYGSQLLSKEHSFNDFEEIGVVRYFPPYEPLVVPSTGTFVQYPVCKLFPIADMSIPYLTWFDYSEYGEDVEEGVSDLIYRRDTHVMQGQCESLDDVFPMHQMFGHLADPQGAGDDPDHEFLLQIDSDALIGLSWLDAGTVYWRMTPEALRAHQWDSAEMYVQSC